MFMDDVQLFMKDVHLVFRWMCMLCSLSVHRVFISWGRLFVGMFMRCGCWSIVMRIGLFWY